MDSNRGSACDPQDKGDVQCLDDGDLHFTDLVRDEWHLATDHEEGERSNKDQVDGASTGTQETTGHEEGFRRGTSPQRDHEAQERAQVPVERVWAEEEQ